MKLITDISDYYDGAIPVFQEADYIWKRKREEFIVPMNTENDLLVFPEQYKYKYDFNLSNSKDKNIRFSDVYMIGVCGEWYYGIVKTYEKTNDGILAYSLDCFNTIMDGNEVKNCTPYWEQYVVNTSIPNSQQIKVSNNKFPIEWVKWEETNAKNHEFWFEKDGINPMTSKWWTEDIFNKYGPILYVKCNYVRSPYIKNINYDKDEDYYTIQTYPDLKALRFVKVMDAYTIMFKLDQWLNNQAIPDNAIVPVGDDITRLQAYGFDKKTSFRKKKEK